MSRLIWDDAASRTIEAGVDRGVLYLAQGGARPWNGLISVKENPSIDVSENYVDGIRYQTRHTPESFSATVECYTYPDELETQQVPFGFCYRTLIETNSNAVPRYKLHLVYNALATPIDKDYGSLDSNADGMSFSFDLWTRPTDVERATPSAHLIVDTSQAYPWTVQALEDLLYGTEDAAPRFPTPQEVLDVFDANSILKITDHGDGTWTAEGPDNVVYQNLDGSWTIDWPSVVQIDTHTYQVSSL